MNELITLSNLDKAQALVAEASLSQATEIIAEAEALRVYAQQASKGLEIQNKCAEIKIRAERRAGELLARMDKAPGGQPYHSTSNKMLPVEPLSSLGISKMDASRWQLEAKLSERDFATWVNETQSKDVEITSSGLRVYIQRKLAFQNIVNMETWPTGKYRVIYADPPWQYSNRQADYFTTQDDHYITMTIEQIRGLPMKDLALENAVLFLWATSPILEDALTVMNDWGFAYKASFVWDKVKHNMGHYNSVRHEFLLVGVRGSCLPDTPKLFDSVQSIERTSHSEKPEFFRQMINTLYPYGPKLELFGLKKVPGWEVYGTQISTYLPR